MHTWCMYLFIDKWRVFISRIYLLVNLLIKLNLVNTCVKLSTWYYDLTVKSLVSYDLNR